MGNEDTVLPGWDIPWSGGEPEKIVVSPEPDTEIRPGPHYRLLDQAPPEDPMFLITIEYDQAKEITIRSLWQRDGAAGQLRFVRRDMFNGAPVLLPSGTFAPMHLLESKGANQSATVDLAKFQTAKLPLGWQFHTYDFKDLPE